MGLIYIPNPTVSAHIRIAFPVGSKAWALAASTLTLGTMATSKAILADLGAPNKDSEQNVSDIASITSKRNKE